MGVPRKHRASLGPGKVGEAVVSLPLRAGVWKRREGRFPLLVGCAVAMAAQKKASYGFGAERKDYGTATLVVCRPGLERKRGALCSCSQGTPPKQALLPPASQTACLVFL